MLLPTTTLLGLIVLFFVSFITIARIIRTSRRRQSKLNERRCPCGYLLQNLELPRCPECGSLLGFKGVKLEDLGLTEEEVRAYRQQRSRQLSPPSTSHPDTPDP